MTPEYNSMANSLVMWLACAPGVLIVLYQSWLFFRRSIKDAPRVGLTDKQVKAAIRSATVTSVGPCFVMLTAMLSLMLYVGAPLAWLRVDFIGSIPDRLLYRYAMGIVDSVFVSEDFLLTDLKGENSYHAIPDDLITEIIKLDFDLDGFLYNRALYYDESQGVYDRGNWYVMEGTTEVFAREAKLLDNGDIWILVGRRAGNHDLDSVEYVFRPQKPLDRSISRMSLLPPKRPRVTA